MRKEELTKALAVILLSIITLLFILYSNNFDITGEAIYQSQPNASEGKDTYIRENIDTNYGDGETIKIGKTSGDVELRSLMEFNLSEIPESHTVSEAKISINSIYASEDETVVVNIYRITQPWTENGSTWYNKTEGEPWEEEGGDYDSEIIDTIEVTNETRWFNISITDLAQNWVNNSYENHGIILIPKYDTEKGNYRDFGSSEREGEEPKITIEHSENAPPVIENVTTDSASDNPKKTGENLTFDIKWYDLENDEAKIYVCNSSNISDEGCEEKQFCFINYTKTSPQSCSYTITGEENWKTDYWVKMCDEYGCSDTFNNSFYVHQKPSVLLIDPIGNETINQSEGNYTIKFNITDPEIYNLKSNLYYGEEQNSTANEIATDLNISKYCTNSGEDKECFYSWNTSGIYGNYYMTVEVNDSFSLVTDSSEENFTVVSMKDEFPPNITSQWLDPVDLHSGKQTTFYANVSDNKEVEKVWVSVDDSENITMTNISENIYAADWTSTTEGTHEFKVYAEDRVGNINNTMQWETFTINKPIANSENEYSPLEALPYHTIKISGELNSTDSLKGVNAYLNAPEGFTFLEDYPRSLNLGNFSYNETKTAVWFVSAPFEEGNYTLNITYSDLYGNTWNSSNFNTEITSAMGDYDLDLEGHTYVVGGDDYYAESTFKLSEEYVSPDSMELSLYDAAGNLIVDSISMNQIEKGKYNYTYEVPSSAVEGSWETRVNATKDSESYHVNEFWRVVGGPFDVRNVQIVDSETEELEIDVDVENTGDLDKDFSLEWNLTEENNGTVLDSGGETFMVPANSVETWTVYPSTDFTGEAKITLLGTDVMSGQKAGAYETFTITEPTEEPTEEPSEGGGGGSGAPEPGEEPTGEEDIEVDFEPIVNIGKGIKKTTSFSIENTGNKTINNLILKIQGLDKEIYEIVPEKIETLSAGKTKKFNTTFSGKDIGETNFNYAIISDQINKTYSGKLIVTDLKQHLLDRINKLEETYNELKNELLEYEEHELIQKLDNCKKTLDSARTNIDSENYIEAREEINQAEDCINKIKNEFEKSEKEITEPDYSLWIIAGGVLFLMVLIIIVIIIYRTYKKFNLMTFLKKETKNKKKRENKNTAHADIDQKIKNIKEKLGEPEED